MPNIGVFNFVTLKGGVHPPGQTLGEITRPRVDGEAYRRSGIRGNTFTLTSQVDVDSEVEAKAEIEGYKAIQATLQTVVDSSGQTWTNVVIVRVDPQSRKKIEGAVGGLSTLKGYFVTAQWTLKMSIQ